LYERPKRDILTLSISALFSSWLCLSASEEKYDIKIIIEWHDKNIFISWLAKCVAVSNYFFHLCLKNIYWPTNDIYHGAIAVHLELVCNTLVYQLIFYIFFKGWTLMYLFICSQYFLSIILFLYSYAHYIICYVISSFFCYNSNITCHVTRIPFIQLNSWFCLQYLSNEIFDQWVRIL
jgi:hypothetical protein